MKSIISGFGLIMIIGIISMLFLENNEQPDIEFRNYEKKVVVNTLEEKSMEMIETIVLLEKKSRELMGIASISKLNQASLAVIRKDRYGHEMSGLDKLFWEGFLGKLPVQYINNREEPIPAIEGLEEFIEPAQGADIDFVHMIAVIDAYYSDLETSDEQERYYDYLCSWGGDLLTFTMDMVSYSDLNQVVEESELVQYAMETLGTEAVSSFSESDFLADIDGVNIAKLMIENKLLLSQGLRMYYRTDLVNNRMTLFVDGFGGEEAFIDTVNCFYHDQVEQKYATDEDFIDFFEKFQTMKKLIISVSGDGKREATELEKKVTMEVFIKKVLRMNDY